MNPSPSDRQPPRVVVGISAYRSDRPVIELIERVVDEEWPVEAVVVVDSMGSGSLADHVARHPQRDRILYHDSQTNLGSAGNLRRRLELASDMGADFLLALNHDARADRGIVTALLEHAHLDGVGALYPLRFRSGKGVYDLTGTRDFSFRVRGSTTRPEEELISVDWSSSNGALYATSPLRDDGIGPDPSLWMGWEDYLYGLQLSALGYRQYIVTDAEAVDDYEYKAVRLAGHKVAVADKPSWYLYYSIRNMILANAHEVRDGWRATKTALWAVAMAGHVWKQPDRQQRLFAASAYLRGIFDGLRNRRGKWVHP